MGVITIDLPSLTELTIGNTEADSSNFYYGSIVLRSMINILV